jgi:hypothetical protein
LLTQVEASHQLADTDLEQLQAALQSCIVFGRDIGNVSDSWGNPASRCGLISTRTWLDCWDCRATKSRRRCRPCCRAFKFTQFRGNPDLISAVLRAIKPELQDLVGLSSMIIRAATGRTVPLY